MLVGKNPPNLGQRIRVDPSFAHAKQLQHFASLAYADCTNWFGPVDDPQWPIAIVPWNRTLCERTLLRRRYSIFFSEEPSIEGTCMKLGHEIYHRVTMCRKGLRELVWVDEMMACMTSHQLLREHGMEEYVEAKEQDCLNRQPEKLNVRAVRELKLRRRWLDAILKDNPYPPGFEVYIRKLGLALQAVVGWRLLCSIITARTLEGWIGSLPKEMRYAVCRVLDLEAAGGEPSLAAALASAPKPTTLQAYQALGTALYWKGDYEGAIFALQTALLLQPNNTIIRFRLSTAFYHAGQLDKAIVKLKEILAYSPQDPSLHLTLGNYYLHKGDPEAAERAIRQAIALQPDRAYYYYSLGEALEAQGHREEAIAQWKKVLLLDHSFVANSAKKKLQELC